MAMLSKIVQGYWSAWPLRGILIISALFAIWTKYSAVDLDYTCLAMLSAAIIEVHVADLMLRYTGMTKTSPIDLLYIVQGELDHPSLRHSKFFETAWVVLVVLFASIPFQELQRMALQ